MTMCSKGEGGYGVKEFICLLLKSGRDGVIHVLLKSGRGDVMRRTP